MGPYKYKTIYLNVGMFGSPQSAVEKIQRAIDDHVNDGWDLFEYHPVQTAITWKWNVLIFRKPNTE